MIQNLSISFKSCGLVIIAWYWLHLYIKSLDLHTSFLYIGNCSSLAPFLQRQRSIKGDITNAPPQRDFIEFSTIHFHIVQTHKKYPEKE